MVSQDGHAPLTVVEGGRGPRLACRASAEPSPRFRWFFRDAAKDAAASGKLGEELVALSEAASDEPSLELSALAVERRHAGAYVCVASNALGEARAELSMRVLCKCV